MAEVAQRFGPYTCVRRLGAGGMAETFLAVQHGAAGFEQRVCMKFMLGALRNDHNFRQMFLREATIAASLRHANIVGVIDVDDEAGYIVLELVDGVDLRRLLDSVPNRRLAPHVVSLIAVELCKALSYAHGRTRRGAPDGIVHRDISPSNVLVSHNGEVKLTDFGVAKAMRSVTEPTSAGIKGKLCYMSPEQARGEALDGRSDLFSLGVMLFELLAGVRPFDGPSDAQTVIRIESGKHPALVELAPDVPGGLALIVERLLRRDPDHRYPSADAGIDALARFAAPITTYRELGQLARAARPPVTLSTGDFATPGSGQHAVFDPQHAGADRQPTIPLSPAAAARGARTLRGHSQPELQPLPPSAARPAAPPKRGPEPEWVPRAVRVSGPVRISDSGRARPRRNVSRGAWLALAGSLLVAAIVTLAWISRFGGALADASDLDSSQKRGPLPLPPPGAADATARVDPEEHAQGETSSLVQFELPPASQPTAPAPSEPSNTSETTPPPPRPAHDEPPRPQAQALAELRVGTVPLGQVWIDGAPAGWAPVIVNLPPGVHSVAGGNTSPEIKRNVKLRAGETRRLVLNLEKDSQFGDEATEAPAGR